MRVRGEWLKGLSFSAEDIVTHDGAIYIAKNDRPCYDTPPNENENYKLIPIEEFIAQQKA